METIPAHVAGAFYPASEKSCLALIESTLSVEFPDVTVPEKIHGGIVPHAGWVYSGSTAGLVYRAIKSRTSPRTFILFGAVHVPGVRRPAMVDRGAWETPLGDIPIDEALAGRIREELGDLLEIDPRPHRHEHSLEVQLPYIRHLFPESAIIPIMVPPSEEAVETGARIARIVAEEDGQVVFIGSTDLTHYGRNFGFTPAGTGSAALRWMKETNDRQMVDRCTRLEAEEVVKEAERHHNACGAGAVAALLSSVKTLGASRGTLLRYTTSFDESGGNDYSVIVGYMGMVF